VAANLRSIDISPWLICRGSGHSFIRSTGLGLPLRPELLEVDRHLTAKWQVAGSQLGYAAKNR
jgi:hypothetical protein